MDSAGIDYHVMLAANAIQQCLDIPELQPELLCALVKQTSRLTSAAPSTSSASGDSGGNSGVQVTPTHSAANAFSASASHSKNKTQGKHGKRVSFTFAWLLNVTFKKFTIYFFNKFAKQCKLFKTASLLFILYIYLSEKKVYNLFYHTCHAVRIINFFGRKTQSTYQHCISLSAILFSHILTSVQ